MDVRGLENGAQKRTRTSTPLRAPAPEAGASTNSAIWARGRGRALLAHLLVVNSDRERLRHGAGRGMGRARNLSRIVMKDKLVTLIGGGGFIGRYVAQELL